MRTLIAMVLLVLSTSVFAEQITVNSDLSDAQQAAIRAKVAQMEADALKAADTAASVAIESPAVMKEWAEMSGAIAQGVGDTARELGVAANDFLDSPAGVITVLLIAYHFVGNTFIQLGLLFILFPALIITYLRVLRWIRVESIEYEQVGSGGRSMFLRRILVTRNFGLLLGHLRLSVSRRSLSP